jgi:hypothetical protein
MQLYKEDETNYLILKKKQFYLKLIIFIIKACDNMQQVSILNKYQIYSKKN